jgi:hypothetical protein
MFKYKKCSNLKKQIKIIERWKMFKSKKNQIKNIQI